VVDTGTGYVAITVDGVEAARVDANGRLGIGTTSPFYPLDVAGTLRVRHVDTDLFGTIRGPASRDLRIDIDANSDTDALVVRDLRDDSERFIVQAGGNVGIGTSSPSESLTNRGNVLIETNSTSADSGNGLFWQSTTAGWSTSSSHAAIYGKRVDASNGYLRFDTRQSGTTQEAMRIDSSGNLLVGMTSASSNSRGAYLDNDGFVSFTRDNNRVMVIGRGTGSATDGDILEFRKDGTTVGSIGVDGDYFVFNKSAVKLGKPETGQLLILTSSQTGTPRITPVDDNAVDLGGSGNRWDDIYATNGTIQTSDRNEKQDIEALSDAEQRVAVAAKGLLRKYRWKDAVAEKGDAARIHFGIIAQDLQAAFEAEGLDAARYGMFISSTWWEAERVIPAVEAVEAQDAVYETVVIPAEYDEDGNEISPEHTEQVLVSEAVEAVEAQPERTVTDTFETQEEAPEGAVQRTRMGVRYPELLAFIIAAI